MWMEGITLKVSQAAKSYWVPLHNFPMRMHIISLPNSVLYHCPYSLEAKMLEISSLKIQDISPTST